MHKQDHIPVYLQIVGGRLQKCHNLTCSTYSSFQNERLLYLNVPTIEYRFQYQHFKIKINLLLPPLQSSVEGIHLNNQKNVSLYFLIHNVMSMGIIKISFFRICRYPLSMCFSQRSTLVMDFLVDTFLCGTQSRSFNVLPNIFFLMKMSSSSRCHVCLLASISFVMPTNCNRLMCGLAVSAVKLNQEHSLLFQMKLQQKEMFL